MIIAALQTIAGSTMLALLAAQAADPTLPAQTDLVVSDKVQPIDVIVRAGQVETCSVNPPVLLLRQGSARVDGGNGLDLRRVAPEGGVVNLVSFGPAFFFKDNAEPDQTVMMLIDSLTVRDGTVRSKNEQAWALFNKLKPGEMILHPRSGDFSLCRLRAASLASAEGKRGRFGALRASGAQTIPGYGGMAGLGAKLSTAVSAVLDIFGLGETAWLRVQVRSVPNGADIYLGGSHQASHTDTALDVVASELPHLRLEKPGYEPCPFARWQAVLEPRYKHVLTATCTLTPQSKNAK